LNPLVLPAAGGDPFFFPFFPSFFLEALVVAARRLVDRVVPRVHGLFVWAAVSLPWIFVVFCVASHSIPYLDFFLLRSPPQRLNCVLEVAGDAFLAFSLYFFGGPLELNFLFCFFFFFSPPADSEHRRARLNPVAV